MYPLSYLRPWRPSRALLAIKLKRSLNGLVNDIVAFSARLIKFMSQRKFYLETTNILELRGTFLVFPRRCLASQMRQQENALRPPFEREEAGVRGCGTGVCNPANAMHRWEILRQKRNNSFLGLIHLLARRSVLFALYSEVSLITRLFTLYDSVKLALWTHQLETWWIN